MIVRYLGTIHKGGRMEKDLCTEIGYRWKNLEDWNVRKAMVHNPIQEVQFYQTELERLTIEEDNF